MGLTDVNLLKLKLANQIKMLMKGVGSFFGMKMEVDIDTVNDIQNKIQMFLDNPELAEEMTLEDIVGVIEEFNDTLDIKPFTEVIDGLKKDVLELRGSMVEVLNKPFTVVNPVTERVVETFNTTLIDELRQSIYKINGEMQGFSKKEDTVKLQRRVKTIEDLLPTLQSQIDDLRNELDTWKKDDKKDVTIYKGNGQSMTLGVLSVFGRTGHIIPTLGDYTASLITYTPTAPLTATNVQDALDQLVGYIGGGSGDVIGPSSSIDYAIPVFDGTTGKIIKMPNTTATPTIDANGDMTMGDQANVKIIRWKGSSDLPSYITYRNNGIYVGVNGAEVSQVLQLIDESPATPRGITFDISLTSANNTIQWRDRGGQPVFLDEIAGFEYVANKDVAGGYVGSESSIVPYRLSYHTTNPGVATNQVDGIHRRSISPTGNEDRANGYVTNDIWITPTEIWICTDDANGTPGAAVWNQVIMGGFNFAKTYSMSTLQI